MGKTVTKATKITCDNENCGQETTEDDAKKIYPRWYLCSDCQDKYPGWFFKGSVNVRRYMNDSGRKKLPSPQFIRNNVWLAIGNRRHHDTYFGKHESIEDAKSSCESFLRGGETYLVGLYDGYDSIDESPSREIVWS